MIKASPLEEKKDEAPKKLIVSDLFKAQAKQPEIPVKKTFDKQEAPKVGNNLFGR